MTVTENELSIVDADGFSVRRSIHIAASLDDVWTAITDPTHISRWFGRAEFDGSGVGAQGTLTWDDRGSIPIRIESLDAPHAISYRWSNDDTAEILPTRVDENRSTLFTFTLDAVAGGTRLTVVETGFETLSDPAVNLESHRQGWNTELDSLVALLTDAA